LTSRAKVEGNKTLASKLVAVSLPAHFQPTPLLTPFTVMSQHRSLKTSGSVGTKRSVLKRGERIKLLKSRGLWKEGRLPTNLPKTKSE
jgi:small basic protein (TIGR04137 family)